MVWQKSKKKSVEKKPTSLIYSDSDEDGNVEDVMNDSGEETEAGRA